MSIVFRRASAMLLGPSLNLKRFGDMGWRLLSFALCVICVCRVVGGTVVISLFSLSVQ